jgi:Cu/Ag efflux protein CusF
MSMAVCVKISELDRPQTERDPGRCIQATLHSVTKLARKRSWLKLNRRLRPISHHMEGTPMKPNRSLALAVVVASLMSTASFAAYAADIPLGSAALESHIVTKVLAVDAANYQVTIEGPDNSQVPLQLSDKAKNLRNLKVGDKVDIHVVRSVAYVLDTDVDGARGLATKSGITRADKDNPNPGGEAFRQVKVTSKITHIDVNKHEVTLLPPEGKVHVVKVEDPELQARMKNLKVGQTVEATFTEVLKIKTSR